MASLHCILSYLFQKIIIRKEREREEELISYPQSFFADSALALWLLLCLRSLDLNTSQLWVDEDTATILTRDDLLVHLDIELALRWNLVEATATCITLHVNDTQTVAGTLADTLEAGEQTWLNLLLKLESLLLQTLLLLTGFRHDVVKLRTLLYQARLAVSLLLLSLVQVELALADLLLYPRGSSCCKARFPTPGTRFPCSKYHTRGCC